MAEINIDEVIFISETSLTIRESRRRTTVPKEIVEELGLKNGDKLRWLLFEDGKVLLTKVKRKPRTKR
ncbi:MAG: AbrB/MazE/SpoVT family DNA-binding domain-containing protein [Candidatus Heimdallarchaeota archaeon]|nr:AbrB/MazE/SpoVT family DNA-binding domain-containing protein [Candidatus Heimdallarchaeota archaeon]